MTLNPGETTVEVKTADIAAGSAAGDVLFAFDLTGSMGGALNNVKAEAVNIMTAVGAVISDVQFGLTSHMDYPGSFSTSIAAGQACNYSAPYGSALAGDMEYILNQTITSNQSTVATAISGMSLGSGVDSPESYTTILYESYAELVGETHPTEGPIGWRTGSKKIVVAFQDNVPHDCDYNAIIGGTSDTGHEPGRDFLVGTGDDLHILDVLNEMAANNVTLINLHNGGQNTLWDAYANVTGGVSFQTNFDGTIPGGISPADKIAELIEDEVSMVDELTLEICPAFSPAYDPWIVSVTPPSHTGLTLPAVEMFDLELGPPLGTAPGVYTFDVCLIGDGAEFGRQTVDITVPDDTGECDPLALLDDLGSLIDDYVEDGIIPAWAGTMLMGFVEDARTALIVGNREGPNPVRAGREMRHLMGIILASVEDNRISEEDAQPLIDAAIAVNECLGQPTRPKPPHEEEPTGPPARRKSAR